MEYDLNPYDLYDGGDIPFMRSADEDDYNEYGIEREDLPQTVEVVYCQDCRWYGTEPEQYGGGCRWWPEEQPDYDDFCSWGERRPDAWKR